MHNDRIVPEDNWDILSYVPHPFFVGMGKLYAPGGPL